MPARQRILTRRLALILAAVGVNACATQAPPLQAPAPAELPAYEARFADDPGDVDTGLMLAAGYRDAGRSEEAWAVVQRLLEEEPDDAGVILMSAFVLEDRGEWDAAVEAYDRILDSAPGEALRGEVARRAEIARREALRADVRNALLREAEVAQQAPPPATIGVFPFVYEGSDQEWAPLALALADLLTTDLGITGRLTVVERVAVQTLLDELALGESGRVESATAARSGRLLGSRHIVQGRLRVEGQSVIGVDASLVGVGEPGAEEVDPLTARNDVQRFFELEKQLAFDLYEELGVQLTPAERELVNERQTESIEALLAYGRGLAASDAGNFSLAGEEFREASRIDPSFSLSQSRAVEAASLVPSSVTQAAADLAGLARGEGLQREAVERLTNAPAAIRQRVLSNLGQQQRSVLAEILGQDRVGQVILLELVFQGPGGEE
jgi:tetratricopeptide (TPR) repeat protein